MRHYCQSGNAAPTQLPVAATMPLHLDILEPADPDEVTFTLSDLVITWADNRLHLTLPHQRLLWRLAHDPNCPIPLPSLFAALDPVTVCKCTTDGAPRSRHDEQEAIVRAVAVISQRSLCSCGHQLPITLCPDDDWRLDLDPSQVTVRQEEPPSPEPQSSSPPNDPSSQSQQPPSQPTSPPAPSDSTAGSFSKPTGATPTEPTQLPGT